MRLLLIEDDQDLAKGLRHDLAAKGFAVDWADNGRDGAFLGAEQTYDAVVLDLGLPGKPGLDVLREWRARKLTTPVLILTARDAWHERVDGLKAGADDYLGKPFHVEELIARLHALVRRASGQADPTLQVAGLTLDEDRQLVTLAGRRGIGVDGHGVSTAALLHAQPEQGAVQASAPGTHLRPANRARQQPDRGLRAPTAGEDRARTRPHPARTGLCVSIRSLMSR